MQKSNGYLSLFTSLSITQEGVWNTFWYQ